MTKFIEVEICFETKLYTGEGAIYDSKDIRKLTINIDKIATVMPWGEQDLIEMVNGSKYLTNKELNRKVLKDE